MLGVKLNKNNFEMSQMVCLGLFLAVIMLGAVLAYMLLSKKATPVMYIKNGLVEDKYNSLVEVLGKPNTIENNTIQHIIKQYHITSYIAYNAIEQ